MTSVCRCCLAGYSHGTGMCGHQDMSSIVSSSMWPPVGRCDPTGVDVYVVLCTTHDS